MSNQAKAGTVLVLWAISMLGMLAFMIIDLIAGYPQVLAMIFWMVIVTWICGQTLERLRTSGSRSL